MAHPWEDQVLGGVGVPRFLILSQDQVANKFFDVNLDGYDVYVDENPSANMTRVIDVDAFGTYMGKMTGTGGNDTSIRYRWNVGSSLLNRRFLAKFRIKLGAGESSTVVIQLYNSTNQVVEMTRVVTHEVQEIIISGTSAQAGGSPNHFIELRIHYNAPGSPFPDATHELFIDNLMFFEVYNDYAFPQPQTSFLGFKKITYGRNETWSGGIQEFSKRWRPFWHGEWKAIEAGFEQQRQIISQSTLVFCIPHQDVNWGFVGIWMNDEFKRKYSFERFFAHEGDIDILGTEFTVGKPIFDPSYGGIYIGDDILY